MEREQLLATFRAKSNKINGGNKRIKCNNERNLQININGIFTPAPA